MNWLLFLEIFIILITAWAVWRDFVDDNFRAENRSLKLQVKKYQEDFASELSKVTREWSSGKNFKEDLAALLRIQQDRMDRCQSEQFWALASYFAISGFLIGLYKEHCPTFPERVAAWIGISLLFLICATFIWDRLINYYRHRRSFNELAYKLPNAPAYMKEDFGLSVDDAVSKGIRSYQASIWILVYSVGLLLPFMGLWLVLHR